MQSDQSTDAFTLELQARRSTSNDAYTLMASDPVRASMMFVRFIIIIIYIKLETIENNFHQN